MTNQELLAEIIGSGDVPPTVSNRLLLEAIIQNREKGDRAIALLTEQNSRITKLEQQTKENPSIIYLLKTQPLQTIKTIGSIIFIIVALATFFNPPVWLLALLGIPIP